MNRTRPKTLSVFAMLLALSSGGAALLWPHVGASQGAPASDEPLPTHVVIDVNAPGRALYRIAVPALLGSTSSETMPVRQPSRTDGFASTAGTQLISPFLST